VLVHLRSHLKGTLLNVAIGALKVLGALHVRDLDVVIVFFLDEEELYLCLL
jgi:hypothetical protein